MGTVSVKFIRNYLRISVWIATFLVISGYLLFSYSTAENYPFHDRAPTQYKAQIPCPEFDETWQFLAEEGCLLFDQGLLIESYDGGTEFAALNADRLFNPASALKIATSLAALDRWGAAHQFRTSFCMDGILDQYQSTLNGDLILYSEGDPTFQIHMLDRLLKKLQQCGVRRVTGNLIINGPFSLNSAYDNYKSAQKLIKRMHRRGIHVNGTVLWEQRPGKLLVSHYSVPLLDIIWYQNAHSSNPIAERLGEALGGTEALTLYLIRYVGLDLEEILITHTSGLDYNRITPRGMLKVLRKLYQWAKANQIPIEKLLPAAGIDSSTLAHRFTAPEYRGGILAKTGTLLETDFGVSTLVGFINTQRYGLLVFALMNSHGDVLTYHRWQNSFLQAFLDRCGGVIPFKLDPESPKTVYKGHQAIHQFLAENNQ